MPMHWIALLPPEAERTAWGWRALQFTPRVAQVDEALLLEVSTSQRLWGGQDRLLRRLFRRRAQPVPYAEGATHLVALALLRLQLRGLPVPAQVPGGLPLAALSAALPWLHTLERTGCSTWGQLRALPRGGVARRFGAGLLDALDMAWGQRPEACAWLALPEVFDMNVELPALATTTPELLWTAQRLLTHLQAWLRARGRGVLALQLQWTLDLKRLDGVALPSHQQLVVRTAQPAQDMAHLRRLLSEHLARETLAAPANHLRLRVLDTAPWAGASRSFLPEDNMPGEKLHEFIERLSVRLGAHNVVVPHARADHRPERRQQWRPARDGAAQRLAQDEPDALQPPWLLPVPVLLPMKDDVPQYGGPLQRLTRASRVMTGWWETSEQGGHTARDYFIARSPEHGLVWIYRDRLGGGPRDRWYLQGLYA
jgi:protein ImuB